MLHRESNPRLSVWQVKALTVSYHCRLVQACEAHTIILTYMANLN